MNRWFDLSASGAKLDRIVDARGLVSLKLSFAEPFDAAGRASAMSRVGWVAGADGKSLQNYATFRDLSEIGTALQAIFGEDVVRAAITARDKLRQGETLMGVDRPLQVEMSYIATGIQRMADHAQDRILAQIEAARVRMKERNLGALGPTGGQFKDLIDRVSSLTEKRPSRVAAQLLLIREDADTMKMVAAAAMDGDAVTAKSDLREILSGLHDSDTRLDNMEKSLRATYGEIPEIEDVLIGDFLLERGSDASVVVDFDRVRSDLSEDLSVGVRDTVRGYRFEISADTTTIIGREMQARLDQALGFIGETFGVDPGDLLTEKTRFRVVQRAGQADIGELGGYSASSKVEDAEGDVEFQSGAVVFRPDLISVALHEIGHQLDSNLGETEGKYDAILGETGLRDAYAAVVAEAQLRAGIGPEFSQYLMRDEEMFARYFENALRQHCKDQTGDLDAIGGTAIAGYRSNYAPLASDKLALFLDAVRDYGRSVGVFPEVRQEPPPPTRSASAGPGM